MQNLAIGTWASIDEHCPVQCSVDGSDLAHLVIGEEDHRIELIFNAAGLRTLTDVCAKAVAEMDALFEQEDARREAEASTALTACGERSA